MRKIGIGFYSGLGDIVSAVPALRTIESSVELHVFVKAGLLKQCREFLARELPDVIWEEFNADRQSVLRLLSRICKLQLDQICISPHAPAEQSSSKIPVLMMLVRLASLFRVTVVGDIADRFSFLYSRRVSVSRSLKLVARERLFFERCKLPRTEKHREIDPRDTEEVYDFFLHYGASSKNKMTSERSFLELMNSLSERHRVVVCGLPKDIGYFRLHASPVVQFAEDSVSGLIEVLRKSRVAVTHDTGFAHIASFLNKPQAVFFGPTASEIYLPDNVRAIAITSDDKRASECMPCAKKDCRRTDGFHCLDFDEVDKTVSRIRSLGSKGNVEASTV